MSRAKYPPPINVSAIGLPDAYYKLVHECLKHGASKKREYGNTYDIISTTEIWNPTIEPMLHPNFPTKESHLAEYEKQWERDYDWKKQGFSYNYMDRLIKYPTALGEVINKMSYYHKSYLKYTDGDEFIDQLKVIRENISARISKGGECLVSNRDQAITWIPDRDMFIDEDQPCLQRLWFQVYEYPCYDRTDDGTIIKNTADIVQKGKAEFHVTWRSRDLYSAWNSNMIALIKMLNKEIFEPNNLELVRVIDFCNSLHIYESDWESASKVKPAVLNPMLIR